MAHLTADTTLTVAVPLTVEVDVNTWVREFGVFPTADTLRRAVREHLYDAIGALPVAQPGAAGPAPLVITTPTR